MIVAAKDTEPGKTYRLNGVAAGENGGNTFYVRAGPRVAQSLEKRLAKKGAHMHTLRFMRGTDPLTKERWEAKVYRALPLDCRLRLLKRKPGYT